MEFTKEIFVQNYYDTVKGNPEVKAKAVDYIHRLLQSPQAWAISKELIELDNLELQFIGTLVLYRKVAASFRTVAPQQQEQIKAYVFTLINQFCEKGSKPVISKLSSTAALIACELVTSTWPHFLQDLASLMGRSAFHLKVGLQILESVTDEFKNLKGQSYAYRETIKNKFLEHQEFMCQIFNSVFDTNQEMCILANLKCLDSWARCSFRVMHDPSLTANILKCCLLNRDTLDLSVEILVSGLKYVSMTNFTTLSSMSVKKQQLSQQQLKNLYLVVEFCVSNADNFFAKPSKSNSEICNMFGFLVKQLLMLYPWIVIEDLNKVGAALLKIMLATLAHPCLKTSAVAVEFFYQFYEELSKIDSPNNNVLTVIGEVYVKVLETLLPKIKKKTLWEKSDNNDAEESDLDDIDEAAEEKNHNGNGNNNDFLGDEPEPEPQGSTVGRRINFRQYRQESERLLSTIHYVFTEVNPSQATSLYFSYISALMNVPANDAQANQKLELALFAVSSLSESAASVSGFYTYVNQMVEQVLAKNPNQPNVRASFLSFVSNFVTYILQSQNFQLFNKVTLYILSSLSDPSVCQNAAACFKSIMNALGSTNDLQLFNALLAYYRTEFRQFNNDTLMQKFVEGFVAFILKMDSPQNLRACISQFLEAANESMVSCIQNQQEVRFINCLKETDIILNNFSCNSGLADRKAVIGELTLIFALKQFQIVEMGLNYAIQHKLKYYNNNQLGTIVSISKHLVKLLKNQQMPLRFLSSLALAIKCFLSSPAENSDILIMLTSTLQEFKGRSLPPLDQWLRQEYPPFNQFMLGLFETSSDPDVIKQFFTVQQAVLHYNPIIFLQAGAYRQEIVNLALRITREVRQTYMNKQVISFLWAYVQQNYPEVRTNYAPILQTEFLSIPDLPSQTYSTIAKTLVHICSGMEETLQYILYEMLKSSPVFCSLSEMRLNLLSRALEFYIKRRDQNSLKATFIYLSSIASGNASNDVWTTIELRYETNRREARKAQMQANTMK